jgi:hypothetical protein
MLCRSCDLSKAAASGWQKVRLLYWFARLFVKLTSALAATKIQPTYIMKSNS